MEKWLKWAIEIQSLSQIGLTYTKDVYDRERYQRLREISAEMPAEMLSMKTEISLEKVKDLFCNETGYQTPKLDTRAAIFRNNKILLVHENNGTWSLPGGWCDVLESVKSNTEKEVKKGKAAVQYLPSADAVLGYVLPKYVSGSVYGAIAESFASEQAARRTAMESATDNANEMISKLELVYNRARQAAVTQEISEIVGGAAAAK